MVIGEDQGLWSQRGPGAGPPSIMSELPTTVTSSLGPLASSLVLQGPVEVASGTVVSTGPGARLCLLVVWP